MWFDLRVRHGARTGTAICTFRNPIKSAGSLIGAKAIKTITRPSDFHRIDDWSIALNVVECDFETSTEIEERTSELHPLIRTVGSGIFSM